MATKEKFPLVIHVTENVLVDGSKPYLFIRQSGVLDPSITADTPCAIYKRVSVGRIVVGRTFEQ
jgi:hypothetical protein